MSVINKMLRDLDSRQLGGLTQVQTSAPRAGLARDTHVIPDFGPSSRRAGRSWLARLLMGLLIVAGLAVAGWVYLRPTAPIPTFSVSKNELAVSPIAGPLTAQATPQPEAPRSVAEPVRLGRSSTVLKMENLLRQTPEIKAPAKPISTVAQRVVPDLLPQGRAVKERQAEPAPVLGVHLPLTTAKIPGPPSSVNSPIPTSTSGTSRPSPSLEALAQAQSLWNAGSREGAMDLLHDALALAERSPAGNAAALSSLARELARMELTEGRVSQALEMLMRLESVLSGSADVWALRGNAAQRLGRHQESAAAYLMALKLRPDEPRWMLGAAVSLAAQGQTDAAAELAEKARAGGVLSREVAAYLRQLGVPLRER